MKLTETIFFSIINGIGVEVDVFFFTFDYIKSGRLVNDFYTNL